MRPAILVSAAVLLLSNLRAQPQLEGCPVFPSNNIWNVPIDKLPVDVNSAGYIQSGGESRSLHPDFGPQAGIPINVVPATQPGVKVTFDYAEESDHGLYPVPEGAKMEGGSDAHVLMVQSGTCRLYELYAARLSGGVWLAGSGAIFDLRSNALRPDGWTSADAAGLPIIPGLVRFDEVNAGEINHALRLTVPHTRNTYVWPARHFASSLSDVVYPPMGQRFRLKADYDISPFDPQVQVILRALKKYGLLLADNGSSWFISGAPDSHWDDEILGQLKQVKGIDLEAVDTSSLMFSASSGVVLVPPRPSGSVVPFTSTPVFDLATGNSQKITLAGDVVSSTILNPEDGQTVTFLICQDSTGGKAFEWPLNVRGGMVVGAVAEKCSSQSFVSFGSILFAVSPGVQDM